MSPDAKQLAANTLYADLMDEAKARIACINDALGGRLGLPAALVREVGFLQLRMLCELIALSCLVAHGDITAKHASKLSDEYKADTIIKRLENLHPNFYPYPVNITVTRGTPGSVHLSDKNAVYLAKSELPKLYGRCGDFLHRGTSRKLLSSKSPTQMQFAGKDFSEIGVWGNKVARLLEVHRISSLDNQRHIICTWSNADDGGRVQVAFAASPSLPQT
jgi:hypothetical protein